MLLLSVFLSLFVFCLLFISAVLRSWSGFAVVARRCPSGGLPVRAPSVLRLGLGVGLGLGGSVAPRSDVRVGRPLSRVCAYGFVVAPLRLGRSVRCPSVCRPSVYRGGQDRPPSVFVSAAVATWMRSLRLCPRSVSVCPPWVAVSVLDAVSGSVWRSSVSVRSGCSAVRAYMVGGSVWSAVRPALSLCGSAVGRCGRRESSARALRSASGGGWRVGWIDGQVGLAPPRLPRFNFLMSTFWL